MDIRSLKISPMAACLCVAALRPASAQADSSHRRATEIAVFVGISQSQRLDVTASPLTFGGRGYDAAGDFTRALGRRTVLDVSLDGGVRKFKTLEGNAGAEERFTDAEGRVALLRELSSSTSASAMALGVALTGSFSITQHQYNDPSGRIADFVVGFCTLGPAAKWYTSVGGGTATVRLTAPLVGLMDHPYSDTRGQSVPQSFQLAGLRTLRGINGAITYAPAEHRRTGLTFAYRFSVLDYADVQPLRSASQSLAVGIVTRLGHGSR